MTIKRKKAYNVIVCKDEADWLRNRNVYLTASDTASALGISKWKSQLDLWAEKTGLRQPKDLSQNEYVIRGKEREPIIRKSFELNHEGLRVEHNPYDIYISNKEGFGMLGATLDGEIEIIGANEWNIPIGYKGVLEIKTVSASDYNQEAVAGWLSGAVPKHYLAQVHQQMFCYDADFAIVQAELDHGEDRAERYVMLPPIVIMVEDAIFDINDTVDKARAFWKYVDTKTPPPTMIEGSVAGATEIVPILADAEVGSFYQNFDAVKKSIEDIVEPYRGVQFTEDQQKDAKEIKANLNKMAKEIDQKRIAVKKKYLQPLDIFEAKANELKKVITDVITPISEQIDEFENQRLREKEALIDALIADAVFAKLSPEIAFFLEEAGGITKDKKWLSKGCKDADIRKDIESQLADFATAYDSIIAFSSDDSELRSMMLSEFARTKNLADAMKAKERIEASREASRLAEERLKARSEELRAKMRAKQEEDEARRIAKERIEASRSLMDNPLPITDKANPITDKANPITDKANPITDKANPITFTFRATHSSKDEWKALIDYMKDHGFTYERIQ